MATSDWYVVARAPSLLSREPWAQIIELPSEDLAGAFRDIAGRLSCGSMCSLLCVYVNSCSVIVFQAIEN